MNYWQGKKRSQETKEKISKSLRGRGSLYKHGLSQTKIAEVYYAAKKRCTNKNDPRFSSYGGRGIKMLWLSVEEFYRDMASSYKKGLQLDRINNDSHYCKKNCRWATRKQQQNNMRSNRYFTLREICDAVGPSYGVVSTRLKRGSSLKQALKKDSDCDHCAGKGYGTSLEFAGNSRGSKELPIMRFCSCHRGVQLKRLTTKYAKSKQ